MVAVKEGVSLGVIESRSSIHPRDCRKNAQSIYSIDRLNKRIENMCNAGDKVMLHQDPSHKHETALHKGPHMVTRVQCDNDTVKLSRATANGGAVSQSAWTDHSCWNDSQGSVKMP